MRERDSRAICSALASSSGFQPLPGSSPWRCLDNDGSGVIDALGPVAEAAYSM